MQYPASSPDTTGPASPDLADLHARFFRGLADPCRIRLLELLLGGEKNVSELVALTGLAQNRVSMHLGCLRTCGFVAARREGRFVYYQVIDPRVRDLLGLARAVIAEHATQILSCAVVAPAAQQGQGEVP